MLVTFRLKSRTLISMADFFSIFLISVTKEKHKRTSLIIFLKTYDSDITFYTTYTQRDIQSYTNTHTPPTNTKHI